MEDVKRAFALCFKKCISVFCFAFVVFIAAKFNCRITFENGKIDICPLQNTYIDSHQ